MKYKEKLGRKILSFFLSLAMVICSLSGTVPGTSMTVHAAGIAQIAPFTIPDDWSNDDSKITAADFEGFVPTSVDAVQALAGTDSIPSSGVCVVLYNIIEGEVCEGVYFQNGNYSGKINLYTHEVTVLYSSSWDTIYYTTGVLTAVTGVTLSQNEITLAKGGTETLTAIVAPDDATDKTVTWSSNNTAVATVDSTGKVTAVAVGTANITATATNGTSDDTTDDKTATCAVTVNAIQTQTEVLLTTITATGKEQASYSVENVATVSFSYTANGYSSYTNSGTTATWGWWGYGWIATVTPADGYTITKCVFYDDKDRTATDSEAPFVVETTEEDKTPQVNGTPILANQSKGITKIEVYGYVTPTHSVIYNTNGGSAVDSATGVTALPDPLPTPTKDGYTFEGWYTDEGLTTAAVAGAEITADTTLYAKWTENIIASTVTLNTNGGTINSGNITEYTEGTGATLPTDVTKEGYAFCGWYDNESLTGSSVSVISETDTGSKEYWAKWVESLVGKTYPVDGTGNLVIERVTWFADGQGSTGTVGLGTYKISFDNLTDNSCLYRLSGNKIYITNDTTKRINALTIVEGTGLPGDPYVFAFLYDNPISYTVTFSVVNGLWDDGTTADKTVILTGYEGDTLKLAANQIPAVSSKPNDTYKAGNWDVTPNTDNAITAATTYTYTYAQKTAISKTVTFKVVNGSWDDETTADKTVTLTGYEGDTLKLSADDIPAVGTKPNDTYKAGSWDTTPNTATAITAATTYTYTYVQKSSITPIVSIEGWTYGESGKSPSVNGNTGNGAVTYAYAKKNTTSFSVTVPSDAGEYIVKAMIAETDNYMAGEATANFTIAKANATVTAPTAKTLTYNGSGQELVTVGEVTGGTLYYAVTTEDTAPTDEKLYTTSIPTKTNAGTYYVWYKVVGDTNHDGIAAASIKVTIAPKELSDDMLTLTPDSFVQDTTVKAPTITVTDTAKSPNALVERIDYTLAADAQTSGTGYGTYTITVNGKGNYTGSATKTWKIEDKTAPTATITVGTHSFNQFLHTITFGIFFKETQAVTITAEDNARGSGIKEVYYYVSDTALTEDAVKALADGSWKEITNGKSFNIDPTRKYVVYVKAVDSSGNKGYVSSDGMVIDAAAPVITGVVAGAEYHSAVNWKAADDYLDKVEITFIAVGKTAGDSVTDTKTADGTQLEDTVSALGSYTVKATDKSGNETTVAFSITRRDAVITGKADSITYEAGKTYDLSQLFPVENGVTVDTYEIVANTEAAAGAGTITGSTLTVTKAGLITIRATVAEGQTRAAAPEYINKTTADGTLTVSRAAGNAGITINDVVYGNQFTVLLSSTNVGVTSETKYTMTADAAGNEIPAASRTESTEKPVNVGTYKAVVSYPASGLYNAVSAETTFQITPATLTVTAEAREKTYGNADPALTYTVAGLAYEDTKETVLTGALTRAAGESVGTYAIGQGTLAANGNYTISYTGADLTIGKKTLTVAAKAKSKTYGAEDPALTYSVSGLENGDTKETVLTGTLTRAEGEAVGTYAIGQGTLTANGNYTVNYTGADLTIGKKTLTVTAEAKSKTYGGEDPALTYSVSGLENGDTKETVLTGALTRAEGVDVGTYAIGQGTLAANGNYTISYTGADLTIGKKTLTVTAEAKNKKYGEDDPALTYTATGFENGDTKDTVLTGALTRKSGEAVGTYAIEQGTLAANDNYTVSYTGADLTITKTDSKVTAPIANTLTYTGKAQALITAGSTTDGTIVYSLDGKTYAETIPTGANAGEYTVYYKVIGDGNHKDSEAVTVSVTIAKAEMADKTVTDAVDAVEVISAGVKDETMDLTEYLKDGAKLEKAETAGELAEYITPGALTGGIFTYSVAENDGGIAGSIVLTVSSTNYKDYNITINLVSAKKITEVVVESEDVKETAVEAVEVPALEDFTEAQPEATVEVKMEVKLESEETVEKALGTAVLEDIKETVAKAFDGVASTELSQEYLDITVTKSVNGGTAEEIADVNRVLEIAVGYDLTGKFNPVVIREHGGAVSQFTKLSSRPAAGNYKDGTFYVEGSGTSGRIYIYARYFSTYTVAYTTAASYQVTFDDATGDAKHDSNVTQVVVATGTKVAKPADPKRDGYDFEGWYISGTNTKWNFDTAVTGDITLVAHWDEEDDDDEEIVATPAPVVTEAPRSPKTGDVLPDYVLWMMIVAAGLSVGGSAVWGRRKEQE